MTLHRFETSEQYACGEHKPKIRRLRPVGGFGQVSDALVALFESESRLSLTRGVVIVCPDQQFLMQRADGRDSMLDGW